MLCTDNVDDWGGCCCHKYPLRRDMKVLVLGTGISGRSAYDFLLKKGYEVEFAKNEDINAKYLSKME